MKLREPLTRNLLFTGKGGVGKTSVACAVAISLADGNRRVLLVSTDPASNLDEVLSTPLKIHPTPVENVPGLFALNVDPERAAEEYRERVVGPFRELLPGAAVRSIEEQLSGACTVEIAAFDEFAKLLGDDRATAQFDHVIFDTAPTGHTLRLLRLPAAWSGFIESNVGRTSSLGPLSGLEAQHKLYDKTVLSLCDGEKKTTVYLVTRPEVSALAEAERTRQELETLGVGHQCLIVNGRFRAARKGDVVAEALESRNNAALASMSEGLRRLPSFEIPLVSRALIGIDALRGLGSPDSGVQEASDVLNTAAEAIPSFAELIPDLAGRGRGVIMTMGKGGVGKTTVAVAIAVELARLGHSVHLTTTDPAAHVSMTLDADIPGLTISRIDPAVETRSYSEEVLRQSGKDLDEKGRSLLEEELRSPCTEEIAVFRAFAQLVDKGNHGFVVIDTAPTGHTLLLLDAGNAYHRDVERNLSSIPDSVRRLLPQLQDPGFTRILIVALPGATPVHEASRLQNDLLRAGITPFGWVINQCLGGTLTRDPLLSTRAELERPYINEVKTLTKHPYLLLWQSDAPVGVERLQELVETGSV